MSKDQIPSGYKLENGIIYGKRVSHPGLFEIKIRKERRNAFTEELQRKITQLLRQAETDQEVKVILFHGGKYFSSGNDISAFLAYGDVDEAKAAAKRGMGVMEKMLLTLSFCKKPIVAVVRGMALGIAFTLLSHVTLLYVAPDAKMMTPFMASGQSPEGTSTYMFPQQFGQKLGNHILLTDQWVTAEMAVNSGFANGYLDTSKIDQ